MVYSSSADSVRYSDQRQLRRVFTTLQRLEWQYVFAEHRRLIRTSPPPPRKNSKKRHVAYQRKNMSGIQPRFPVPDPVQKAGGILFVLYSSWCHLFLLCSTWVLSIWGLRGFYLLFRCVCYTRSTCFGHVLLVKRPSTHQGCNLETRDSPAQVAVGVPCALYLANFAFNCGVAKGLRTSWHVVWRLGKPLVSNLKVLVHTWINLTTMCDVIFLPPESLKVTLLPAVTHALVGILRQ